MSKHTKWKVDDDYTYTYGYDRSISDAQNELIALIPNELPKETARLIAKAYLIPEMRDKLVAVFNDINALYQTYLETIEKEEIDSQLDQDIQLTTSRLGSIEALIKEIDND